MPTLPGFGASTSLHIWASTYAGIAAFSARLESQRLRVCEGSCPNLILKAELYRYEKVGPEGKEKPKDEYNHALAALRYHSIVKPDAIRRRGRGKFQSD
jgi:hypothetical protein